MTFPLSTTSPKYRYPLPVIGDYLDRLNDKWLFTSLDLASGYYQVPISEESREKTGFIIPDGRYEFTCMPLDLVYAQIVFQHIINPMNDPLKNTKVLAFMDDQFSA